jgi:transcriptional regulator
MTRRIPQLLCSSAIAIAVSVNAAHAIDADLIEARVTVFLTFKGLLLVQLTCPAGKFDTERMRAQFIAQQIETEALAAFPRMDIESIRQRARENFENSLRRLPPVEQLADGALCPFMLQAMELESLGNR